MVTLELAKQLKEAGFPQTMKLGSETYGKPGEDWCKKPNLLELIEVCGDKFGALNKYSHGFIASSYGLNPIIYSSSDRLGNKTPEEAVAKLWLELNKE